MEPEAPAQGRRDGPNWALRIVIAVAVVAAVLVVAVIALVAFAAAGRDTTTEEQAFPLDGLGEVRVITTAGDVDVVAEDRGDVQVIARLGSGLFSDASLQAAVVGDTLVVEGECRRWVVFGCVVSPEVRIPSEPPITVSVTTTAGDIDLAGLTGAVVVAATAGDVEIDRYAGPSVSVTTTAGDVEVEASEPPRAIDVRTTAGEIGISVPGGQGYAVDTSTTVGSIEVRVTEDPAAPATIRAATTAGDIAITEG